LHGIAFISQTYNRLISFRRKFFVSGHLACNRTHKCWCSRYSTSLKARFIASLIKTTVFSCFNIIAKGFIMIN
jgi:predicted flavoprotein YhiN